MVDAYLNNSATDRRTLRTVFPSHGNRELILVLLKHMSCIRGSNQKRINLLLITDSQRRKKENGFSFFGFSGSPKHTGHFILQILSPELNARARFSGLWNCCPF